MTAPIYVTRPFLPPLEEFTPYLEKIWNSRWLTNNGPFHEELEHALCKHLGVEYLSLFSNGTIALITALQALRITGEVITTPFSFVATTHSLMWNGIRPVFVDIDRDTFNLDPTRIESAITQRTTAVMPVHCFGYPCAVEAIENIADNYNLKTIYDAAHAFGVDFREKSILNHGDLSVLSFHATKVFNTFEGGAIICHDAKTKLRIDRLKNFGFVDEVTVVATGINGKMSEFNAALGMLQLSKIAEALASRHEIDNLYRELLGGAEGIRCPRPPVGTNHNFAYFPVLVEDSFRMDRDALYQWLRENGVIARRYFYPLISEFSMYRDLPSAQAANLPVATDVASRVLCLPIYPGLERTDVERVVGLIKG